MAVERPVVAPEIRKRLSDQDLAEITASLWPIDCQTCGKTLGASRPSLVVDDIVMFASVSLHHGRCRASQWSESTMPADHGQPMLSFATYSVLLPMGAPDDTAPTYYPTLLVNPGLEMVFIEKDDVGAWRVKLPNIFTHAGFTRPGGGLVVDRPVPGAVARTPRGAVAVTIEAPPYPTYHAGLLDVTSTRVREMGGVFLIATHTIHPHDITEPSQLRSVMQGDRTLAGWVELESVRAQRPKTPAPKTGTTFVLHYSTGHLTVGPLLAHTTDDLDTQRAQQWAREVISDQGDDAEWLLDWESVREDDPSAGWFTMHSLSANQYVLRRYPDGWRLVQALSRADGARIETDNEARAWAASVIEHKTKMTGLTWQSGPTHSNAATFYAQA